MKIIDFLIELRDEYHCIPQSKEGTKVGLPSNAELKRWVQNGVVQVNGSIVNKHHIVTFPITSFVLFPKSKKCTLW